MKAKPKTKDRIQKEREVIKQILGVDDDEFDKKI